MATKREIIAYVKERYGFTPADCWIAHAKVMGVPSKGLDDSGDIGSPSRPCPEYKRIILYKSLRELGVFETNL